MCGICGYIGHHEPALLEAMCDTMVHRGPDAQGTWHDAGHRVGFGHRRLRIIDLSDNARQPMTNEDGSIWLTYNGEIYNYLAHREWLEGRGHVFKSASDTEVILHLYEEFGLDCLNRLNGIFAFALYDKHARRLFLARDHAGVKPLYYYQRGGRLYFASELKALLKAPDVPRSLNRDALPAYLTFLWVPGADTMLADVRKLEPGHYLTVQDGRITMKRWFQLDHDVTEKLSTREWVERMTAFEDAVARQMVSDVPLGAFLSGGLDSASIVACMRRRFPSRKIRCYTARTGKAATQRDGFAEDYPYARQTADHLGVDLRSFALEPDVMTLLPRMVWHLDEPDADPAVFPSYLIARFARSDGVTVLLSGTGGDEVLFGYRSHLAYRRYQQLARLPAGLVQGLFRMLSGGISLVRGAHHPLTRRLAKFAGGLAEEGLGRHCRLADWSAPDVRNALYSDELQAALADPDGIPACFQAYWDEFRGDGDLNRHSYLLLQTFLGAHNFLYTDKTSMAASVEARVPFVDVEFLRLMAAMPEAVKLHGSVTKYPLRRAMASRLPASVIHRRKTGFGAPLRHWMMNDLQPLTAALLSPARVRDRGLFKADAVKRLIQGNQSGKADHAYLIYALLNLEVWMQTFIDGPGEAISF